MVRLQRVNNQVRLAQEAINTGQIERGRVLLDAATAGLNPADSRGFAWSYLNRIVQERVEIFATHRSPIFSLALSPDGRFLSSGDEGGLVRLEDRMTGRGRMLDRRHDVAVYRLEFSPDGRVLATSAGSPFFQINLWGVSDGESLGGIDANVNYCYRIFFSSDDSGLIGLAVGPTSSDNLLIYAKFPGDFESPSWRPEPATIDRLEQFGLRDPRLQRLADLLAGIPSDPVRAAGDAVQLLRGSHPRGIALVRGSPFVLNGLGDGSFEVFHSTHDLPLIEGWIRDQDVVIVRVNKDAGWSRGTPAERRGSSASWGSSRRSPASIPRRSSPTHRPRIASRDTERIARIWR